jgi:hypothetical protein
MQLNKSAILAKVFSSLFFILCTAWSPAKSVEIQGIIEHKAFLLDGNLRQKKVFEFSITRDPKYRIEYSLIAISPEQKMQGSAELVTRVIVGIEDKDAYSLRFSKSMVASLIEPQKLPADDMESWLLWFAFCSDRQTEKEVFVPGFLAEVHHRDLRKEIVFSSSHPRLPETLKVIAPQYFYQQSVPVFTNKAFHPDIFREGYSALETKVASKTNFQSQTLPIELIANRYYPKADARTSADLQLIDSWFVKVTNVLADFRVGSPFTNQTTTVFVFDKRFDNILAGNVSRYVLTNEFWRERNDPLVQATLKRDKRRLGVRGGYASEFSKPFVFLVLTTLLILPLLVIILMKYKKRALPQKHEKPL